MDNSALELKDDYLSRMKTARKSPAVLKIRLASFRSELPRALVFAFEGNDDKTAYFHWITRIRPGLKYEPFPCGGKDQVLQLQEMIERDRGSIGRGVYFFVDRDYDDLRGRAASPEVFMTDAYSVENYLVSTDVLEELLKNEFHCHAEVACRQNIIRLFEATYVEYLNLTRMINFRLFLARRLKIELTSPLPDKISRLANVSIDSVSRSDRLEGELIKMEREPTPEECAGLNNEFDGFDKAQRYRGKFAHLFFMKWLQVLSEDRKLDQPKHFPRVTDGSKVRFERLTLDALASKSRMPNGLREFILGMQLVE